MFWIAFTLWLGLGRKPEERPEVEEGERDGAAVLLGVLRGLLEVEQPWGWSWESRMVFQILLIKHKTCPALEKQRHFYLFASSTGQLLLNRCLFCCWFGSLVWVKANFIHLRTNRDACLTNLWGLQTFLSCCERGSVTCLFPPFHHSSADMAGVVPTVSG